MFHIGTCPHCHKHHLALRVVQVVSRKGNDQNLYLFCPNCSMPSCAIAYCSAGHSPLDLQKTDASTEVLQVHVEKIWPERPAPEIPESIPEGAERALIQAETNFRMAGHDEAAAVMYRKALEVALKEIAPEIKGMLASRIQQLADAGRLTSDIAEWAKEVKSLGNDGAHELEAIERPEVESMRGLVKMVLTYLFTLPEQVRALRQDVSEPA